MHAECTLMPRFRQADQSWGVKCVSAPYNITVYGERHQRRQRAAGAGLCERLHSVVVHIVVEDVKRGRDSQFDDFSSRFIEKHCVLASGLPVDSYIYSCERARRF